MAGPAIFEAFVQEIPENGFPSDMVWLDAGNMHFSGRVLYINSSREFAAREQAEAVYTKYEGRLAEARR